MNSESYFADLRAAIRVVAEVARRELNDFYELGEDTKRHGVVPERIASATQEIRFVIDDLESAEARLLIASELLSDGNASEEASK